jgi:hypothetical protein
MYGNSSFHLQSVFSRSIVTRIKAKSLEGERFMASLSNSFWDCNSDSSTDLRCDLCWRYMLCMGVRPDSCCALNSRRSKSSPGDDFCLHNCSLPSSVNCFYVVYVTRRLAHAGDKLGTIRSHRINRLNRNEIAIRFHLKDQAANCRDAISVPSERQPMNH